MLWGALPIYWKLLAHVPATQILAHRIVWSLAFLGAIAVLRRKPVPFDLLKRPRALVTLVCTAILIALNWGIYIWAVNAGLILQASLGYFISPLVSMLFGVVLLGERLSALRRVAALVVAATVIRHVILQGEVPWVAFALAITINVYALGRKRVNAGALEGLLVETIVLLPLAAGFLIREEIAGRGAFLHHGAGVDVLLLAAGAVTALPLLLYNIGVRLAPLTAIGILQYLSPTMQFLLAVFAYGEACTVEHLFLFGGIWIGLALYSAESLRTWRPGGR